MMTLPSPSGPRRSRLSSPKNVGRTQSHERYHGWDLPHPEVKIDPSLEPSRRGHPTRVPMSEGGGSTPLPGILVVEFQMMPAEGSWRRWP
jgi:hypothetical protein